MPSFTVTCDGGTATCTCEGTCQVGGVIGFNAAALNAIVYGRGSSACGDATSSYTAGMCDVFNRITPANVRIEYRQFAAPAGLGYVGRPAALSPRSKFHCRTYRFGFSFSDCCFKTFRFQHWQQRLRVRISTHAPQ